MARRPTRSVSARRSTAADTAVARPPHAPAGAGLADALNAAAWAEADLHLARAWREADAVHADLRAALAALVRREGAAPRPSAARQRLAAACDRAGFLAERLAAAARVRRLERGDTGGQEPFDAGRHAPAPDAPPPAPGAPVRITTPAIVRRTGGDVEVLVRATVTPPPAPSATPAKRRTRTKPP